MKPIQPMDVCTIVSAKKLKGSGLEVGDSVLVTGTKVLPETRSDPYLQRVYVVVMAFDRDGHLQVPREDNDFKAVLVDPRNLEIQDDDSTEFYRAMIEADFTREEGNVDVH